MIAFTARIFFLDLIATIFKISSYLLSFVFLLCLLSINLIVRLYFDFTINLIRKILCHFNLFSLNRLLMVISSNLSSIIIISFRIFCSIHMNPFSHELQNIMRFVDKNLNNHFIKQRIDFSLDVGVVLSLPIFSS